MKMISCSLDLQVWNCKMIPGKTVDNVLSYCIQSMDGSAVGINSSQLWELSILLCCTQTFQPCIPQCRLCPPFSLSIHFVFFLTCSFFFFLSLFRLATGSGSEGAIKRAGLDSGRLLSSPTLPRCSCILVNRQQGWCTFSHVRWW